MAMAGIPFERITDGTGTPSHGPTTPGHEIAQSVIQTVHGRGYRRVADVAVDDAQTAPPDSTATSPDHHGGESHQQQIRFCRTSDGARLAYATLGAGRVAYSSKGSLTPLNR